MIETARGELLWHYTTRAHLALILESGVINVATGRLPDGERPAVWLSTDQDWERTVGKTVLDPETGQRTSVRGKEQLHAIMGLARIGVDPAVAPRDWRAFKQESGVPHAMARRRYELGLSYGARPSAWRVSFVPIPAAQWRAVEVWDGATWVPWDEAGGTRPAATAGRVVAFPGGVATFADSGGVP